MDDDLGYRMKVFYEQVPKTKLVRRMPVCIRLDGKAFHTFTRGFQKPFDDILIKTMQKTMKYLCKNIQGCVLGYTQSDEITLILVDYKNLTSSAWYDYEVQKMCSVSASMATLAFNKYFTAYTKEFIFNNGENFDKNSNEYALCEIYKKAATNGAMFDSRVFNIPKEEVCNLLYWRQLDATRNSIQMLGQSQFSHKELQNKSCNDIQDMLMLQKGINWNNLDTTKKRGSCCFKCDLYEDNCLRKQWVIDKEIPLFNKNREYVENLIYYDT